MSQVLQFNHGAWQFLHGLHSRQGAADERIKTAREFLAHAAEILTGEYLKPQKCEPLPIIRRAPEECTDDPLARYKQLYVAQPCDARCGCGRKHCMYGCEAWQELERELYD